MRLRWNPYVWLAAVGLGVLAIPFCTRKHSEWEDVYIAAARHLEAGADLYREAVNFTYPPFQAALAVPFAHLPARAARLTYYAINVGCLAWLVTAAWAMAGGGRIRDAARWPLAEHGVFLAGLGCGLWYSFHALAHQQTDVLVAALVVGGCRWLQTGRRTSAGVALGLATAMKCTPLLFAPYLVYRRNFLAAGVMLATAVGANLLPDLIHRSPTGSPWAQRWYEAHIRPMSDPSRPPGTWASDPLYNQSLAGGFNRWLRTEWTWTPARVAIADRADPASPATIGMILRGAQLTIVAAVGVVFLRRWTLAPAANADDADWLAIECGILTTAMLLFSPMSSIPHFCTLVLPGFGLARQAIVRRDRVAGVCVGMAIACAALSNKDLQGGRLYTLTLWHGVVMLNALVLMAGLVWTLAIRRRPAMAETVPVRRAA